MTKQSQLAAELWPLLLPRLERWARNVGGANGVGGSAISVVFTGTIDDSQAPQFLLRSGTRSLQGNLAVDSGITIDGVDLSAHAGDAAAHHAPMTGGDGIAVSGQQAAVDLAASNPGLEFAGGKLQVAAGDGITRTAGGVAVDSSVVRTARQVATGTGLSGGGDLSANRTLIVDQSFAPTWTGIHTFSARPVITNNLLFSGAARTILTDSNWSLTLAPAGTGKLILNPGGVVELFTGTEFRTTTFSDLLTGIAGARLWDKGSNVYQLTLGGLRADELYARTFVADAIRIDRGAEYWSKSYGVVETDFVLPALESTVDVWFEDAAALTGDIFATNDWLLLRTVDWGTSLTLSMVWFQITARVNASSGGRQRWRLMRKAGGTTGQTIRKGAVALDVGVAGQGWVHLSALTQDAGPFIQMGNWATDPSVPSNWTNRVRMGHLSGVAGYGTGKWGFAAGKDLGASVSAFEGVLIEATDGARLLNTAIELYTSSVLDVRISSEHGLALRQDTGEASLTRRSIGWHDNPSTPSATRGIISAWSGTAGNDGDHLYINPSHGVTPGAAAIRLRAGGSGTMADGSGTVNGVAISGTGRFRVYSSSYFYGDLQVYDPGNSGGGVTNSRVAIGTDIDTAAQLKVLSRVTTRRTAVFQAIASQSVPIVEVRNSVGTAVADIGTTGVINSAVGFRTAGTAGAGNYLRGNGTNFVEAAIQAADIPSGSAHYIRNTTSYQTADMRVTGTFDLTGTLGTDWAAPALASGWKNYDAVTTWEDVGYKRFGSIVAIKGLITATANKASGSTIFTLPTGYRPPKNRMFIAWSTPGFIRIDVNSTGAVITRGAVVTDESVSLDCMFFI